MGKRLTAILGVILASVLGAAIVPAQTPSVPVPEAPAVRPVQAPVAAPAGLPAYAFEGVPGWLAFATVRDWASAGYKWLPVSTQAQIAVFADEDSRWAKLPRGQRFTAVGAQGSVAVEFAGFGRQKYGCDQNSATMAMFKGAPSPEGPVWLLPEGVQGVAGVGLATWTSRSASKGLAPWDSVPAALRDTARTAAAWRVYGAGPITVVQFTTSKEAARTVVLSGGRSVLDRVDKKYVMDGAPTEPVTLNPTSVLDVGIPQPIVAFQIASGATTLIVLWTRSYEGNHFDLLRVTPAGARVLEGPYLYYCAF